MPHQTARRLLLKAGDFLLDYEDVPTPTIHVDRDGSVQMRWHLDRQPHSVALDVLRLFDGWHYMPLDSCSTYRTETRDGIELIVFAAQTEAGMAPRVNLLDALSEVSA